MDFFCSDVLLFVNNFQLVSLLLLDVTLCHFSSLLILSIIAQFGLPDLATTEMSTFSLVAMKPRTENTAKPATKLVKLFNMQRKKVSLQTQEHAPY